MKTTILLSAVMFIFHGMLSAAPRLVISTPSLLPDSKIDVVFDQPMVDATDLGKATENKIVSVKPALPGKLFWKSPTIAEFQPEDLPALGTSYTFAINNGVKHLDESKVESGNFATVETEAFRINSAHLLNRWSSDYSPSMGTWLIVFNDEIDLTQAAAFFGFGSEKNQRVAAKLEYANAEQAGYHARIHVPWSQRAVPADQREFLADETILKHILLVTPNSALPVAKNWQLNLLKGLPNASKSTALPDDLSYRIGEVQPFQVASINPHVSVANPRHIVINFNHPIHPEQATEQFSVSPQPDDLSIEISGKTVTLKGNFSTDDLYTVRVGKEIKSTFGQPINRTENTQIKFERLAIELGLPSENEAQLAHGGRNYAISTINLSSINIRVKQISGKGLVRAFQGYRNYSGNGPDWSSMTPTSPLPYALIDGEQLLEKEIQLDIPVDSGKTIDLNWDELIPNLPRHATLFIDVIGTPHPHANANGKRSAQAIVQLTDLGLAWKFTESQSLIYAFSCDTGKPVSGAKIHLYGEDAKLLTEALTDENGIATIDRDKDVRHLHAALGSDSYTVAFDRTLHNVGMWHFPVRYSWLKSQPEKRRAFLFTERSLYRPGETVRLKGIVRDQLGNAIAHTKTAPARLVIVDPQQKEIHTQPITLSRLGSFDISYTLPDEKTGLHTIKLEFPDDLEKAQATDDWEEQIALSESASFELPLRVEEFRRNTFELVQEIDKPTIGASEVNAKLTATYYQGQPVAAGAASTYTQVTSTNPYPDRFRDFLFGDHRVDDWRYWYHHFGYRDDDNNEITTNTFDNDNILSEEGFTSLKIQLPTGEFPTARQVNIATEVTDANNQTLTTRSTTTVHPADLYVGISRIDRLVRVGEETPFRIVLTDTEGAPHPGATTLTATLSRQVHTTTRTSNSRGETTTESDPNEQIISTTEFTLPENASVGEGHPFPITPTQTGLHFLTLRGKDSAGREFATVTRFHAYGSNEYPWKYEDGLRIKLVSEKKSYRPGDTARLHVLSPIEGTALVTVEREKVLSSFLTEIKADNPVIEIPLTDDHAPNAYVSILIVKGAAESAREIKEPQLRLGYAEITVENVRDRLAIDIAEPAESYRPGAEVTLTGTIKLADGTPAAAAELTFYAVDEGTLAVMGYKTPDPIDFFYDPRNLDVVAGTSFQTFLSENPEYRSFHNKGFFIGGGGDPSKLAEIYRKNFDPSATWAPTLVTDAAGKFTHSFTLPDTLTRYRVMAVAHHDGARFGHAETAIIAKKPLMLEQKLPRFAHQGDLLNTQVLVQNASPHHATWQISLVSPESGGSPIYRLEGPAEQTITLAPNTNGTLVFPIRLENTGEALISYQATPLSLNNGTLTSELTSSLSDAVQDSFQVHFPMPLLRQVKSLKLHQETDLIDQLSEQLQTATGTLEVEFARSPLVEVASSVDYLLTYPYGCLEQTSSSLMPWFAVKNLKPYVPAFASKEDREIRAAIQGGVARLLTMQRPNGSFSYWPGSNETVTWGTSYAGLTLALASQNGGNVPPSALENLSQFLIQSLRGIGDTKSAHELEIHTRSLYTLAILGKPQAPYHALLTERLPLLNPSARALLAASMAIEADGRPKTLAAAKSILTSKTPYDSSGGNHWTPGNTADALQLLAWITIDPKASETHLALDKLLHNRNPYGHWRSTWVNGWSLLAISHYAAHETLNDDPSTSPSKRPMAPWKSPSTNSKTPPPAASN